jgi:hypothetical protein
MCEDFQIILVNFGFDWLDVLSLERQKGLEVKPEGWKNEVSGT